MMDEETIIVKKINELKKDKKSEMDGLNLVKVLKILSPGTSIRTAIDDILRAHMGGLIIFDNGKLTDIVEGGFRVNCKFSAQRLVELAKMDGAIILSDDGKKILYANTVIVPDIGISSKETGTRHKAAERAAKQVNTLVIAVSERKNKISLYYGDVRYELEQSSEILRRATETLQMLEKQKDIFDELLSNLNILEINGLTTISDVCEVLQRFEIIKKVSATVKRYLVELGKEGIIVSMRLKELTKNLKQEEDLVLKDYFNSKYLRALSMLESMNFDFLLDTSNISRLLFEELNDNSVSPNGIRILSKTNLLEKDIKLLILHFNSLDKIFEATDEELLNVFKKEEYVKSFGKEINKLKEKIMVGKKI